MNESARRVAGLVAVAVLVAVGCTFAGFWQWQRGEDRERDVATLRTNFSAPAVPLDEIVDAPTSELAEAEAWRPVTVTGRYLDGATVLLRNRPVDGRPAFHLLATFEVDAPGSTLDGSLLVVDRGSIPIGSDATGEVEVPAPPTGEVTIEVRVRPAERESSRTAPPGQAHSIHPEQVVATALARTDRPGAVVSRVYGSLVVESPAPAVAPGPLPLPSTDYGPHRSYAMQWWMFAAGALVGFGILAWRERRAEDPDDDASRDEGVSSPAPVRVSRRRRRPTAEEEEDALIDAQASETRIDAQASETRSR